MIVGIHGTIVKKEPTRLHIDVNGLIYEVHVSLNCSSGITEEKVQLHTLHIFREDAQLLFGFLEINEQKMFEQLIKINGVGPKVAMAICSTYTPQSFAYIVEHNDVSALKKVPGIGPKSAGRILVELSGFSLAIQATSHEGVSSKAQDEAFMALKSLGFKEDSISKTLSTLSETDTAALVKAALKKLQRL
jgi:Holliday junction DNA helicase RuvA